VGIVEELTEIWPNEVCDRTIGQNDFGMLYESLFSLGIMTIVADLKWKGQYSSLIQILVIYTIFPRHLLVEMRGLRCLQEIWFGPGVENEKHLAIASLNSWSEKRSQLILSTYRISFRSLVLIGLFSAELYKLWRVCHRLGRVLHRQFLNKMDSIASKNFFLTQFIKSHGLLFDDTISYILPSKNFLLVSHIVNLYSFQLCRSPSLQYLLRLVVYS